MKEHEGEKGVGEGRIRMVCIGGGSMRREHEEGGRKGVVSYLTSSRRHAPVSLAPRFRVVVVAPGCSFSSRKGLVNL